MSNLKIIVRLVKVVAVALFALGMAMAWVAPENLPSIDIARPSTVKPSWDLGLSAKFPGCAQKVDGIPSHLVVETRNGEPHKVLWTKKQDADREASWNNENPADDLFVLGQCK